MAKTNFKIKTAIRTTQETSRNEGARLPCGVKEQNDQNEAHSDQDQPPDCGKIFQKKNSFKFSKDMMVVPGEEKPIENRQ